MKYGGRRDERVDITLKETTWRKNGGLEQERGFVLDDGWSAMTVRGKDRTEALAAGLEYLAEKLRQLRLKAKAAYYLAERGGVDAHGDDGLSPAELAITLLWPLDKIFGPEKDLLDISKMLVQGAFTDPEEQPTVDFEISADEWALAGAELERIDPELRARLYAKAHEAITDRDARVVQVEHRKRVHEALADGLETQSSALGVANAAAETAVADLRRSPLVGRCVRGGPRELPIEAVDAASSLATAE